MSMTENGLRLAVYTREAIPSFKNHKRAIPTPSGKHRTLTEPSVKKRMEELESGILSALYSSCQTSGGETDSACLKRLRTVLCGLCDDSLSQIPEASFGVEYSSQPGVIIEIKLL